VSRVPRLVRFPRGHTLPPRLLDLAHGRATDATAEASAAAAASQDGDDHRGDEGGPAEPQEGR